MMSSRFEGFCIVLMSLGHLCVMTGYDTQSILLESVVHSIHERTPERIDQYAGYYGQGVCVTLFMVGCIFSPALLNLTSPKMTLFIGSLCFTVFHIGFWYINPYYYYFSSGVMGLGFAIFHTGHGGYLMSHSSRETIQANSAIAWLISTVCILIGGFIMIMVFSYTALDPLPVELINASNATEHNHYRQFSDLDIFLMYTVFAIITVAANVIFLCLPDEEVENCIEGRDTKRTNFKEQMRLIFSTFFEKDVLILTSFFLHNGLWISFWICVYPTTFAFNLELASYIYLPAIYAIGVGIGEITMGLFVASMNKRVKDFGLQPTMALGCALCIIVLALISLSTPIHATTVPTNEPPLLFQPTLTVCLTIAILVGMTDCCLNNVRLNICALAVPHRRPQTFSISKFYQALGGAVFLFLSPYLSVLHNTGLLVVSMFISMFTFYHVARRTQKMERKLTIQKFTPDRLTP